MPRLFTYGTLQLPDVQRELFGRTLAGAPDTLSGWREETLHITDPTVVRLSGHSTHKVLVPGDGPALSGSVLDLSDAELAAADAYETDDYVRTALVLGSGTTAFVYVGRNHA